MKYLDLPSNDPVQIGLIVVGTTLGFIIICLGIIWSRKIILRNKRKTQEPERRPSNCINVQATHSPNLNKFNSLKKRSTFVSLVYDILKGQPDKTNSSNDIDDQIINLPYNTSREISKNRFEVGDEIGKGHFGKVSKGKLFGLLNSTSETPVAIKGISSCSKEPEINDFLMEIKLMSNINPHLNIVSMIGACSSEVKHHGKLWLLLEFCSHGDFKNYLIENKEKILSGKERDSINGRCLIKWTYDIANGMKYLAGNHIMHGDLAARNILMDENLLHGGRLVAKVADFGLSKKFYDNVTYEKHSRLLVPWKRMAIEYLTRDIFTLKSDVWSFGVLFWEIITFGGTPYGHQGYDEILEKLEDGYRLQCPKEVDQIKGWNAKEMFNNLSSACFLSDPLERASFSKIVEIFESALFEEEIENYNEMKEVYQSTRIDNYLGQ